MYILYIYPLILVHVHIPLDISTCTHIPLDISTCTLVDVHVHVEQN